MTRPDIGVAGLGLHRILHPQLEQAGRPATTRSRQRFTRPAPGARNVSVVSPSAAPVTDDVAPSNVATDASPTVHRSGASPTSLLLSSSAVPRNTRCPFSGTKTMESAGSATSVATWRCTVNVTWRV